MMRSAKDVDGVRAALGRIGAHGHVLEGLTMVFCELAQHNVDLEEDVDRIGREKEVAVDAAGGAEYEMEKAQVLLAEVREERAASARRHQREADAYTT